MADNSSPDYKLRLQQLEERYEREKTLRKQAEEGQKQAEDEGNQEKERRKQAEERQRQAEDEGKQDKERARRTTFMELMRHCHNLLSRPLKAETPSRSTTGKIPLPTGKYCPTRLEMWTDCPALQQEIYNSVYCYLQPTEETDARWFTPLIALEEHARQFNLRPISSEQGVEAYERIAIEDYVRDIIAELCKIDAARDEFGLGDGILFDNHTNSLSPDEGIEEDANQPSSVHHPRPDQFCIHRIDGETNTLLTTVEYKPRHKLSEETLRMGLRPMDLWKDMVRSNKIPQEENKKRKYNAERLVCSAIVQEYHAMIQEGLEYSYLTNGIARVLLRVPYDDPSTLYYFFCDPNRELEGEIVQNLYEPTTSIARVLCLCLMAFRSPVRDQEWRHAARSKLHLWTTSFAHTRSQIPKEELQQLSSPHSDSTNPKYPSPESGSAYEPSSSPREPAAAERPRIPTRSQASCAPSNVRQRTQSPDSSGSDRNQATGRKRGFSQVPSSPSAQRAARRDARKHQSNQSRRHDARFCSQRCLLGLQTGDLLDDYCPNVKLHRHGRNDSRHPIDAKDLVRRLNGQLDENIDRNCTPFGNCGAYGAPFKLTYAEYGYTVMGKGTTTSLWKEVSREAHIYQILRKAQGSAVPVFLGTIDLAKIYFLHGAGEIRHMLLMGWAGESTAAMELSSSLRQEIRRSNKEIKALGIIHEDLRRDNILWNNELGRALIIDFHGATLDCRPKKRSRLVKRQLCQTELLGSKRLRVL